MSSKGAHRSLENLLVATDFSPGAASAMERAVRLPLARNARVHVFHVLSGRISNEPHEQSDVGVEEQLRSAVAAITETARTVGRSDLRISSGLGHGQEHEEIGREARRRNSDLIVVGRQGRRSPGGLVIGSTAERVVGEGDVPVLVVSLKGIRVYRRPLVAVDLTGAPQIVQGIIDLATKLIDTSVNRVLLLHAYEIPFEGRMRSALDHEALRSYRRQWKETASREMRSVRGQLLTTHARLKTVLRTGDPRSVIVREAQVRHVDVLVLGSHGHSGMAHALLGCLVEWVIRSAPCDIAIQRQDPPGRASGRLHLASATPP